MQNPFFEEWRACLRSHYQHVVQQNDLVTEPTLRAVMIETGFTDAEMNQLRYALAGEVPAGFADETVITVIEETPAPVEVVEVVVVEQIIELAAIEPPQPEAIIAPVEESLIEEPTPEPPPPVKPAKPTVQLSLF